jgi:lipid II:glycine glycyltransferase (peptidoglycan interpeptide bridge formation enzyme)
MAQDFYAAFALGDDERTMATIDLDGVALAAIQGLHQLAEERAARVEALEAQSAAQQEQIDQLASRLAALETGATPRLKSTILPGAGALLAAVGMAWAARWSTSPRPRKEER